MQGTACVSGPSMAPIWLHNWDFASMARGKRHPTAVKQIVIKILHHLSVTHTCEITGLKESTVWRILNEFLTLGYIASPVKASHKPRIHKLSCEHVQVVSISFCQIQCSICPQFLLGRLDQSPILLLDELRTELTEQFNICVSNVTIWRELRRAGMSLKKVCEDNLSAQCSPGVFRLLRQLGSEVV